jgi:hypothetical protein
MRKPYSKALILALAGVFTASADQITGTLSGTLTGSLNGNPFTQQSFTLMFTTDTSLNVTYGPGNFSTAPGTSMTFAIVSVGSGTLTDDQALFLNQGCQCGGFGHYLSFDALDFSGAQFATWDLASNLGPIAVAPLAATNQFATSVGNLFLSYSSDLVFEAAVAPEPSSITLAGLGFAFAAAFAVRQRKPAN